MTPRSTPWVPHGPPSEWTRAQIVDHIKTAIMIELTTIPLYLYATYSIKPDSSGGEAARKAIRGIFLQEMLHLALSGNLLCAFDEFMRLYDFDIIPRFPGKILYDRVEMSLESANKENLDRFIKLEAPHRPTSILAPAKDVIPEYHSIGQFYEKLQEGLKTLPEDAFKNNPMLQFSPNDFRFGGDMKIITSNTIAQAALKLIIDQGEGSTSGDTSHYSIFIDLSEKHESWKSYDVPKNPNTSDYKRPDLQDFAYKLSLAFDAGYCYLLQNIQRVWEKGNEEPQLHNHLVKNIREIMRNILPHLSDILLLQRPPLDPKNLHSALVKLVNDAEAVAPDTAIKTKLKDMALNIETVMTPHPPSI